MPGFILLLFLNLGSSASLDKIFPQVISSIYKILHFSLVSQISGASKLISDYLLEYISSLFQFRKCQNIISCGDSSSLTCMEFFPSSPLSLTKGIWLSWGIWAPETLQNDFSICLYEISQRRVKQNLKHQQVSLLLSTDWEGCQRWLKRWLKKELFHNIRDKQWFHIHDPEH